MYKSPENPTWKNTLNHEAYPAYLSDILAAAASIGYTYASWADGDVYTYERDRFNNLIVVPTAFTIGDVNANTQHLLSL